MASKSAKGKFLDRVHQGFLEYATETWEGLKAQKPEKIEISWADGPPWVRLYNLGWTAYFDGGNHEVHAWEDELGVDLDEAAIRASWKAFGKKEEPFFVQSAFPGNEGEVELLEPAAKKLRKSFGAAKGPFAENPLSNVWMEWEAVLVALVDDVILAAIEDLRKTAPFKKVELEIGGHDGAGPYEFGNTAGDLEAVREAAGYQPSKALLEDFVGRHASNAGYVKHWVAAIHACKPKKRLHPITGKTCR